MSSKYRVRFAQVKHAIPIDSVPLQPLQEGHRALTKGKSKLGCRECKIRRVKCDETYPRCKRCQARGAICRSAARSVQWQIELPWLQLGPSLSPMSCETNHRLLQYWLEKASQIMVIDPDINPLSFPILQYLELSPALLHSVQSISAAHEQHFSSTCLEKCLEERSYALTLFQQELRDNDKPPQVAFLTILMLGLSSAWIDCDTKTDIGLAHLHGARAIIDTLIKDKGINNSYVQLAVGCYIYWDQACAFLQPSDEAFQPYNLDILTVVQEMRNTYHPLVGHSAELFYLLGNLGRYCRFAIDHGVRDYTLELNFKEQLVTWESRETDRHLVLLTDVFRKHGLILLQSTNDVQEHDWHPDQFNDVTTDFDPWPSFRCDDGSTGINNNIFENQVVYERDNGNDTDNIHLHFDQERDIKEYAIDILKDLAEIPDSHSYHIVLALPLLSAGAELSEEDTEAKDIVRKRFKALFSMNRLPANLFALELLEEIWVLHSQGAEISWLTLMLQKRWNLVLT